jgi:hypothetical protein
VTSHLVLSANSSIHLRRCLVPARLLSGRSGLVITADYGHAGGKRDRIPRFGVGVGMGMRYNHATTIENQHPKREGPTS